MRCDRCAYWDHREVAHSALAIAPQDAQAFGRCRRHAPHLPRAGMRGEWPTTEANDWCGEFTERGDDVL